MTHIISTSKKNPVSDKKASFLRLAKPEKCDFTCVNDHFEGKRNEKNGVFLRRLIIILIIIIGLGEMLQAQEPLNRYLETAAENNPELQAKFNEYMAALEVAPQVKALPDPKVAFAWFISPVETREGPQRLQISASQYFPWFGTLKAKKSAAVQNAKAKYEVFKQTRSRLFQEVKVEFYNLYFNERAIKITLDNIQLLKSIRHMAIVKIESGLVSMVDEYRIQMEINELENQLALLRDEKWALQTGFRNMLNAGNDLNINLPDTLRQSDFPLKKQAALDSIQAGNHQLIKLDFRQAALANQKRAAKKAGMPDFNVGMTYTVIGQGENNASGKDAFVFPSVGITIPLYRKKYKAMVNEVAYLEVANQKKKENEKDALETLFEKTWKNYRDADRRILLYEKQAKLAQRALTLLESEYAAENTDFEEILRMERRVLKYNLEFEKAKTDKQAAIAFIHYLMGE